MKGYISILVLCGLACITGCNDISAEKNTTPVGVTYDNTLDDFELTNGKVVVEISPVRARIMGYRLANKNNIFWGGILWYPHDVGLAEKRWNNYGGSRVWVLPQGIIQRMTLGRHNPPDAQADGLPWKVLHRDDRRVVMQSDVSPKTGLLLKREIILSENDSTVTINDTMTRKLNIDCPVHLWRITQTKPAAYMLMDLQDNPNWKYRLMVNRQELLDTNSVNPVAEGSVLKVNWMNSGCYKVGSYGNWVAAVYDDQVFVQYGAYNSKGFYIDGANCEIYVDPQAYMLELESLSPTKMLRLGESVQTITVWKLWPRENTTSVREIIQRINKEL